MEPFKEQINQLNAQISDLKKEQARAAKENFSLQVEKVVEQTTKISVDADNLTNALKSDSKAQGTWGEMVLERTLEESGLRQGIDYELQKNPLKIKAVKITFLMQLSIFQTIETLL